MCCIVKYDFLSDFQTLCFCRRCNANCLPHPWWNSYITGRLQKCSTIIVVVFKVVGHCRTFNCHLSYYQSLRLYIQSVDWKWSKRSTKSWPIFCPPLVFSFWNHGDVVCFGTFIQNSQGTSSSQTYLETNLHFKKD